MSPISVAAELETIRRRGHVVVAVREQWRPLSFRSPEGDWMGLEIDLARRLAAEIVGSPEAVVFEPVANVQRLPAVLEDRVDFAIAGLTITPARMRVVDFSPPYYLDGTGVLVRQGQYQTLQAVQRQRVGVLQGSSAIGYLRYTLPFAVLAPLDSYQQALEHLSTGRVDAFAADLTVLTGWQQTHDGYTLLPTALSVDPLGVALPKGTQYTSLRSQVNTAVTTWLEDGWLDERATFWGLP
ncbi:transporter substrate-binding domain-containing protein [Nodosilinea sp. P-1105]|uniref:transporter substrate-binding domain-containing protein n=1 Tax=Nodosilinea sp. P-1105 TaxID=2546229 RepID=UPI0032425558